MENIKLQTLKLNLAADRSGLARTADYGRGRRAVWRDVRMTWRAATTAGSHASEEEERAMLEKEEED